MKPGDLLIVISPIGLRGSYERPMWLNNKIFFKKPSLSTTSVTPFEQDDILLVVDSMQFDTLIMRSTAMLCLTHMGLFWFRWEDMSKGTYDALKVIKG